MGIKNDNSDFFTMNQIDFIEPILDPKNERFTMYPIQFPEFHQLYKTSIKNFWTVEEVKLEADTKHWKQLNDNEKHFIKHVLAFFAASDGIVNSNLIKNMCTAVTDIEISSVYSFQGAVETIHGEMYSILIDTFITDLYEKEKLLNAIEQVPSVQHKAEWALKWIENGTFTEKVVAFLAVEGVFFSGSFCAIYWLKATKPGLLPGLTLSNEWIARDERLHCDTAVAVYRRLVNKLPVEVIHSIFREAVATEIEFVTESLPVKLIGMNAEKMSDYIRFIADFYVEQLGAPKIWNISECPFEFMKWISMDSKANFFERDVSQYSRAETTDFTLLEDF